MKKLIVAVVALCCFIPALMADRPLYLFAYFVNKSSYGLRLAYSEDGLDWKTLMDGRTLYNPNDTSKQFIFRDPTIVMGPDTTFHLLFTAMGHSRYFGYASSKDLVHWSSPRKINVMDYEPTTLNVWDPEAIYDEDSGLFYIFWSSTIPDRYKFYSCNPGDKEWNHRIYYTTTRDFETFAPTKLYFNPNFNIIDAAVIKDPVKKDYIMVLKNENSDQKNIRIVRSKNLDKGFSKRVSKSITPAACAAEGPAPLWVGDTLMVYFDKFREGHYGAVRSLDRGKTWTDVTDEVNFPPGISHGTPIAIDREILTSLFPEIAR